MHIALQLACLLWLVLGIDVLRLASSAWHSLQLISVHVHCVRSLVPGEPVLALASSVPRPLRSPDLRIETPTVVALSGLLVDAALLDFDAGVDASLAFVSVLSLVQPCLHAA